MKMNPAVVYKFKSKAEKKIFQAFEKSSFDGFFFHSLNIPEHIEKQFGEADFVIVSAHGVLIIEVKGGRISVRNGLWYTKDADNKTSRLKESPLIQVQGAWESLKGILQKKLVDFDFKKINFGYGLMFPDVKLGDIGVELVEVEVFDAINWDRREVEKWISRLYKHWKTKTKRDTPLSVEEVQVICSALRVEFDREKSLLAEVDDNWEEMISLTEQQYALVDSITANDRVIVEGGAGTGKTLISIRASRILDASGQSVLFVCRSPVLASFIGQNLRDTKIKVLSFDSLVQKIHHNKLDEFDYLVVDEGQDMLDIESFDLLDGLFKDGISTGRWYFFMDPNNQGSLYSDLDRDILEYLKQNAFRMPLNKNCRNTRKIAEYTLLNTGGDIGYTPIEAEGLPVIWKDKFYDTQEVLLGLLESQLEAWIDDESVKPGDIAMLSPVDFELSVASRISKRFRRKITIINENFGERWMDSQIPYSTIKNFKGLENKYILLIDLDRLSFDDSSKKLLYIGMTRAHSMLWIATPSNCKAWFEQQKISNQEAFKEYISR